MKPQETIKVPDVCNILVPHNPHENWARYARININWDSLEHQTTARLQSSNALLYRFDIERVLHVNNRRAQTAFLSNQQCVSQFTSSLFSDYFGLVYYSEVCFVDVYERWLFSTQALSANAVSVILNALLEATVPDNTI